MVNFTWNNSDWNAKDAAFITNMLPLLMLLYIERLSLDIEYRPYKCVGHYFNFIFPTFIYEILLILINWFEL